MCVPFPPLPASSSSDPSCLPLCLHRGCAELTFLLRCSSFCVDIHINYPDCQEQLSGVTILLSTSLCVIINDFIGIRETTYGKCVCHTSGLNGEVPSQPPGRKEEGGRRRRRRSGGCGSRSRDQFPDWEESKGGEGLGRKEQRSVQS